MKDTLGWGFALWLVGYALSLVLFAFVPVSLIGWILMPIGTVIALWVAFRKLNGNTLRHYCLVALAWTLIAVLGDYLFIVKAFPPADGYYKPDVYLYYALTLAIPLFAGRKSSACCAERLTTAPDVRRLPNTSRASCWR